MSSQDRVTAALAIATAAFVSAPIILPDAARAQSVRRRVEPDIGRRESVGYVRGCDLSGADFFYIPGTETCLRIGGYGRFQQTDIGDQTGIGTVIKQGDPFFAHSSDYLKGGQVGTSLSVDLGEWRHRFGGSYTWASATTKASEPTGGYDIGYVPGQESLGNGWNFGDYGADATSKLTYDRWDFSYKGTHAINLDGGGLSWGPSADPNNPLKKRFGAIASLRSSTLDHDGDLKTLLSPDYGVDVNQRLDSFEAGFGPSISARRDIGNGFFVWGGADAQVIFRQSTLHSKEEICFPCGNGNSAIESKFNDKKDSVDGRLNLQAALGRQITDNLSIKIGGGVEFGGRDVYDIRKSPGEESTHIKRVGYTDWNVGVTARFKLGTR